MVKRVIVIGHGYFGSLYRERIAKHPKFDLAGVVDPDINRLRMVQGCTVADSYRRMLDNVDHDCVVICTPPTYHCELSVLALQNGKDVLCMKPGALSMTEVERIKNASDFDVIFQVDYTTLRAPEWGLFIDQTMLGAAASMGFYRNVASGPKPEGCIMDLLPHDVAMFMHSGNFAPDVMRVRCVSDGISASADIYGDDDHLAHLSCGYNAPFPMKKATMWIRPQPDITNPRIIIEWDQIARSVNTLTQGNQIKVFFKHDPDPITRSLDDWEWRMAYKIPQHNLFTNTMQVLQAMRESAADNGRLRTVPK